MNMKKNLFFALFACATLAFVGCEPTPNQPTGDDTTKVVITVTPETLLLGVGDTEKLNAVVEPAGTQITITWTSDDEEVVTVAPSGIVIATGVGTANVIASAEGATADTCVITVTNDALYDNFVFSDYALFATNEGIQLIPGSETVVELGIGETVCSLAELYFVGWDEDIVFVDGAGFSGAGFYFENLVQVYIVNDPDPAKAQYNGALVGWGGFWVDTLEAAEPYVVEAGQLVDVQMYGDAWKAILTAETQEQFDAAAALYYGSQKGTQIFYYDFDNNAPEYNSGNVAEAVITTDEAGELLYYMKIDWFDAVNQERLYGLLCELEETEDGEMQLKGIVEPYDMRTILKEYTNATMEEPAEAIGKFRMLPQDKFRGVKPVMPHESRTLSTHKMYMK
jgi:hypothetical protein